MPLESPFAPVYPWLRADLAYRPFLRCDNGGLYGAEDPIFRRRQIDLRDLQTRAAVLRALHDVGHSRPWALGQPWSALTDEQAGRATAAILRAVGEDPARPVGVVPVCVLGAWRWAIPHEPGRSCGMSVRDSIMGDMDRIRVCEPPSMAMGWHAMGQHGPETGDAGRLAADAAARALGCIMIEDLTP